MPCSASHSRAMASDCSAVRTTRRPGCGTSPSGEQIRQFKGHTWWVWSAAFSPDESHIVTASQDGTAIVWSVDSEEKSAPFTGHAGPVYSAAFSPDGQFVATAGYDKRVLLWRPDQVRPFDFSTLIGQQSGTAHELHALTGHSAPVRCVRFSTDGKYAVHGQP